MRVMLLVCFLKVVFVVVMMLGCFMCVFFRLWLKFRCWCSWWCCVMVVMVMCR